MIPYIPIGPVPVPATTGAIPFASDVRFGVAVGEGTGTLRVPSPNSVLTGVLVDATTGTYVSPPVGKVRSGTNYGAGGTALVGTDVLPDIEDVRLDTGYGTDGVEFVGTLEGGSGGVTPPDTGNIWARMTVRDAQNNPIEGEDFRFVLMAAPSGAGNIYVGDTFATSGTDGLIELQLVKGATYHVLDAANYRLKNGEITVPLTGTSFDLPQNLRAA